MNNKRYIAAKWIVTALTIIWSGYIIMHSCLDSSASSASSMGVVKILENIINGIAPNTINESNIDTFHGVVRKLIGHFGLFVIEGIFASWSVYLWSVEKIKISHFYWQISISLAFGSLLATLTEIIQLFIPGRSGEFKDILIDFSGYILGLTIIFLICLIKYLNKKRHTEHD